MLTPSQNLAISYVIIYPTILLPANYCLIRHGKYGILGWIGLISFCAVRIVGAILELLDSKSIAAQIISGVGLNPLILGVLGIIHESSHYISTKKPWALKLPPYLLLHGTAMGAVGLIVPGFVSPKSSSASSLIRVGTMLLLVVWLVLVGLCILSLKFPKENTDAQRLIYATSLALPFLGIRTIYTVIGTFDTAINSRTGPIAYRATLVTLMELVTAIILVVVGVLTRNICRQSGKGAFGGYQDIPLNSPSGRLLSSRPGTGR